MAEAPQVIGEAHDYDSLVAILRLRKNALRLSDAVTDDIAGLTAGHTGNLLGPSRVKTLGAMSLSALLGALALRLVVVEDVEQAARVRDRWGRRDELRVRRPAA
jgi:hypothetical protein